MIHVRYCCGESSTTAWISANVSIHAFLLATVGQGLTHFEILEVRL